MIDELIDHINEIYSKSFGDFAFSYEVIYETTRYEKGRHINFSTDWENYPNPQSKALRCLSSASAYIGFWENHDKGNERFHPLFILRAGVCGVSIQSTPLLQGKKYKDIKKRILSILYGEIRGALLGGHKLFCGGLYPDLRTEIKQFYIVESYGKKFRVESLDRLKPPFNVNDTEYQFIAPNYSSNFISEIDPYSIINPIYKRYKFIEKIHQKYTK